MPVQPYVQQLLDKLKEQMNTSGTDLYLPSLLKRLGYDPYKPPQGDSWTIDSLPGSGGKNAAKNICTGVWGSKGSFGIPSENPNVSPPSELPYLQLTKVVVSGTSEVTADSLTSSGADGYTITMKLNNFEPFVVTGHFELIQWCCETEDHKTCVAGTSAANTGTGTFTTTIKPVANQAPPITVVLEITELAKGVLTFEAKSAAYKPDISNVTIVAKVDQLEKFWQQSVDEALGDPGTIETVIGQVNEQLNHHDFLRQLGAQLTTQIDDYLKANHQYPFNGMPALAL